MNRSIKRVFSLFLFFCSLSVILCVFNANASIVMRIMGVNPDERLTQTVKLKAYLPSEVEPEDILEKSDLEVIYDTQKGAYYVYGEYELGPKDSIHREVELKDIWLISKLELEGLRADTIKTAILLENTQFKDRAIFLKKGIEDKLDDILKRQEISAANPQKHISEYRENVKFLESAKTDLILIRSLLAQAKPLPSLAIWKVFLGIIIFLGLTGFSLFFFWHKRAKLMDRAPAGAEVFVDSQEEEILEAGQASQAAAGEEAAGEEEGKKLSPDEIEKMMEGE